jgi:UDP-N-acetylglucosamine diphosphorylase/glucosamine-1-phosphate N-acetyltransferase
MALRHVIVLAAGKGTRMESDRAKVLHEAAGRPLVLWMCDLAAALDPATLVVVVGHQADEVASVLPPTAVPALQRVQLGTGHATEIGLDSITGGRDDSIVVLPGDMPLIHAATLRALVAHHETSAVAATVLTVRLEDPTGYGRVLREGARVVRIVEHRDATDAERAVDEVNTSVYVFRRGDLEDALGEVTHDNSQGERYLTDVVQVLVAKGRPVGSLSADAVEGAGVNTLDQLALASAELVRRAAGG